MIKFKDFLVEKLFNKSVESPSVEVAYNGHTLTIRFDSKDTVVSAGYTGQFSPWLSSLCSMMRGKTVNDLSMFTIKTWEEEFKDDQAFWDLRAELGEPFFFKPLELLKASLDIFRGKESSYEARSPLVCRCFGIRESDILDHLKTEATPTLDTLASVSKAGMGCRSCVPQLKRWLVLHEPKKGHHYKDRPVADWLIDIDYMVSCFPKAFDWKMEVQGMKGKQVSISFDKEVSQKDEEATAKELQDFLGASVDDGLGFFLRRARHFSKAKG